MGSGRGPVAREPGEAAQPTQATCHRWPQPRATECAAPCPALHAKTWAACRQVTDGGQKCGQMHPAQAGAIIEAALLCNVESWALCPARFNDGECAADARHVGSEPATKYKESSMSRVNKLSKLFRKSAPYRTRKWAKLAASSALHRNPWISEDLKNNPYFWVN